jgi:apolipoprotein N-acyltransferase
MRRVRGLRGRRADAAAAVLGCVAASALPPVYVLPALLVAFPGLMALIDGATGIVGAARRGFWFAFTLHVIGLYWVTEAILFEAARFWWLIPLAVPALAATLAVFAAVAAAVARIAAPGWPRIAAFAGAWTLADLARQFVLTGFPWNPLGSVWALPGMLGDLAIQPASLVGAHGLTFATICGASAVALGRRGLLVAVGLMACWLGFGAVRLGADRPSDPTVDVAIIQGNVAQGQKWDQSRRLEIFRHYLELTREAVRSEAASGRKLVIIWPETASPFLLAEDQAARSAIVTAAGPDAITLAGSVRFGADDKPRNSLVAVGPTGGVLAVYDKWHLVPFGEYQPDWFPIPIQVVPGGGFGAGPGPKTIAVEGLPPFGALICYEAIFAGEIVSASARPAWLVNITNDAWFGNSSGPRQHLVTARLRAVETGLPLVRAANTGISAIFDGQGHELGRLGLGTSGILEESLPGPQRVTLFSRYGLAVPAVIGLSAVIMALLWRRRCGQKSA